MDPITPRDPLDPHPREGGRGKGKPSQLEDWKSLKPKPPQPRGLVGFLKESFLDPKCAKICQKVEIHMQEIHPTALDI